MEQPSHAAPGLHCDVLVVGGGINGCGIARDLAGRGWKVVLAERDDLAAHTSSASTKLIHGGLRYLEHGEFALVRKSLQERERLLASAPHILRPLAFVLPHDAAMRPAWMLRAGLFLYDHLARRDWLPGSQAIDLRRHPAGAALQPHLQRGFVYSDGWADDARLVLLCALDAHERGATVLTRTACTRAVRDATGWTATLRGTDGRERSVRARALVNAAGPWAESFLREQAVPARGEALATRRLRLVQGSHIVVPRRAEHAYLFQSPDGRIVFAIPYEGAFTLIGTTDVEVHGDPAAARIGADETAYLCERVNRCLARPVAPADVIWSYAGVRPLLDDADGNPSAVTRDYRLEAPDDGAAPLLTVWGGKLTTFRLLAEEAANLLGRRLGARRPAWTACAPLPGGDLAAWCGGAALAPSQVFVRFLAAVRRRWPWLPAPLAERLAQAYGSRIERVLGAAATLEGLGEQVAPGLHEAELDHLCRDEWACDGDDVLWRRSKLGLHLGLAERERVAAWMAARADALC